MRHFRLLNLTRANFAWEVAEWRLSIKRKIKNRDIENVRELKIRKNKRR